MFRKKWEAPWLLLERAELIIRSISKDAVERAPGMRVLDIRFVVCFVGSLACRK